PPTHSHCLRPAPRCMHGPCADFLRPRAGRRRGLLPGAGPRHVERTGGAVVSAVEVPPPEEIIRYEKDRATRIATITIDRPDQLNVPTIGARRRYADLL